MPRVRARDPRRDERDPLGAARGPRASGSVTRVARFAPRRLAPRRAIYSAVGAAAAAVLALSISSGVSVQPGDDAATAAPSPLVVITDGDDAADYQALRTYRRLQLATDIATPPSSRPHSFGVSGT